MYELVRIKKCLTKPAKSFIFTHIARALDHLVRCPFYIYEYRTVLRRSGDKGVSSAIGGEALF